MNTNVPRWFALGIVLCLPFVTRDLVAQEHPSEHPKSAEHPRSHATGVTKDDLGAAIEAYVRGEMAKNGGAWEVEDKDAQTKLQLVLEKVHKDKLAMTEKDTYFACADFKGSDGHSYDLDVFMKGPDKDHLTVTEVSVHKKDGQARYTWETDGKLWRKVPAKPAKGY